MKNTKLEVLGTDRRLTKNDTVTIRELTKTERDRNAHLKRVGLGVSLADVMNDNGSRQPYRHRPNLNDTEFDNQ